MVRPMGKAKVTGDGAAELDEPREPGSGGQAAELLVSTSSEELLEQAAKVFSSSMVDRLRARGRDLIERGGEGSYVFDLEGNEYLDCEGSRGTYNLGRANEVLAEELRASSRDLDQGNFVMLSEHKAKLAARLSSFVPGNLDCALFTVVRGEPVDAACKLARGVTGRPGLVSMAGACHGETGFALSLSDDAGGDLFGSLVPEVTVLPFGDFAAAEKAIGKSTAAVIVEPVQAESGCRVLEKSYARRLRKLCDRAGALLIVDETVTGFGRTGSRFAFEQLGITPDILILGEAMSGGLFPMTGLLFTRELKSFFDDHPLIHLCTFGGHDLGCRVAMRAIDEYERLRPWELARLRGGGLQSMLVDLQRGFPHLIEKVSGKGLLLCLHLCSEEKAEALCRKGREKGLLLSQGKLARQTIVLAPSLLISEKEMNEMVENLSSSLFEIS